MISVGSGGGRKRVGSGLQMEATELEEGETLGYHDEGEVSTIDPDIAFSYIEEKLHNVLGHFQKDFEGGVSAENLGAKFGGYGSFLPTYQRSPSSSHMRSPVEVQNYESPRSPRKLHLEDQRRNSIASSSANPPARSRDASGKSTSVENTFKASSLPPKHAEESNLKSGDIKRSVNPSDQRTLKVRIKVGSEKLSAQKNAELYTGLGLVVSPSSSADDSPTNSEGQGAKLSNALEESPTSILQMMTSSPGNLLLSPLSEDLIHLTEKRKLLGNLENNQLDNTSLDNSRVLENGYLSSRSKQKIEQKKMKPYDKNAAFSVDSANKNDNDNKNNAASLLKKEKDIEIDTSGCEELVSNALKLPLISSTQCTIVDPAKDVFTSMNVPLSSLKDGEGEALSKFTVKEHFDTESTEEIGRLQKMGGALSSPGKTSESKFASKIATFLHIDAPPEDKSHDLDHCDSNATKGRKAVTEEGIKRASEKSSTRSKRKQKGDHSVNSQGANMGKDELMVESSLTHKGGRSSHSYSHVPKTDTFDHQKIHEKPTDRYKDFFGDLEFENDDNESISGEMTSSGGLKLPDYVYRKGLSENCHMLEKCDDDIPDKLPQEADHGLTSHLNHPHENVPLSEAPIGPLPVVQEDWVSCDGCHKWRLLPLGTNPNNLPHKWICRMLTWLPGMNRCSIPEEETTNALRALYNPAAPVPAPASENRHVRLSDSVGTLGGLAPADTRYPDQERQNSSVQRFSGKKKHGSAKASYSMGLDGYTKHSNLPKNLSSSGRTSNLNSRSRSPSLDSRGYQHMHQTASAVENYGDAKRGKISLVNCTGKDTNLKRSKRDADVEGSRTPKRIKGEDLHFDDDNWTSDNGGTSSKAGRGSSSLSNNTSDNYQCKNDKRKAMSGEANKNIFLSRNAEKHAAGTSNDDLLDSGKCDKESVRKRKPKESISIQTHTEPVPSSGRYHQDCSNFTEEMFKTDKKEKKVRVSKSGGKDTSGSKASTKTDGKSRGSKEQYNGQYLSSSQAANYVKSDINPLQPLVAANSSSSKVSGSHKNKTSGQETKDSPVESVSSSPLRPSADKIVSSRKKLDGKNDFLDSGSLPAISPKRHSGDEDGGNDQIRLVQNHVADLYNDRMLSEQHKAEEKTNVDQSQIGGFHTKKSGKSKEKVYASRMELGLANIKALDSSHDSLDHVDVYDKSKSRSKSDDRFGNPSKSEKLIAKKDNAVGTSNESNKIQSQRKFGHDGPDAIKYPDRKHNLQSERNNEKLPRKTNQAEACDGEKSRSLPPSAKIRPETASTMQPACGLQKGTSLKPAVADAFDNGNVLKEPSQRKKVENPNGQPVRDPTPNSHKLRDADAPSPLRRDSSSLAANNALKEAKDLKHLADRLKNSGSGESIRYYFEAALKFLHGASLLESGSSEATKHNDLMHSMRIYSSTANLCEFCAHEYERSKDMASAALAYKCMEVAYLRVVYSSHNSASRDRNELYNALQIAPSGESPSSSASDVDNLNHQTATDKVSLAKAVSSPQVSGSHIITSRNRSSFLCLLNFAQDVNFAMEASRKSRIAFTAATSRLGETLQGECISSLKKALDFNFQEIETLLRLVRVAMEAIVVR